MQRGRSNSAAIALLAIILATVPTSLLQAKPTAPRPSTVSSLEKVGLYPTQVLATVKSLQRVTVSGTDQTFILVKLTIHATKPLTLQGTLINSDESLDVISSEPINTASIGKRVIAQIEMRGDSTRQQWLMTSLAIRPR